MSITDDQIVSAIENPQGANQAVQQFLGPGPLTLPNILEEDDDVPKDEIELPVGKVNSDGELVTKAVVRELNGEDEEALAKSPNPARTIATVLERGTVSVGTEPSSPHLLRSLLTGDRAALLIGIRSITYGNELDSSIFCPTCNEYLEITVHLDTDIPIRKLDDPYKRKFEIELRKGKAEVVLPDGFVEESVLEAQKLTVAEQNTLLLSKCVKTINGRPITGTAPVAKLGIQDRRKILNFLNEKSPGPQFGEVTVKHEQCGNEVPVLISAGDLFL